MLRGAFAGPLPRGSSSRHRQLRAGLLDRHRLQPALGRGHLARRPAQGPGCRRTRAPPDVGGRPAASPPTAGRSPFPQRRHRYGVQVLREEDRPAGRDRESPRRGTAGPRGERAHRVPGNLRQSLSDFGRSRLRSLRRLRTRPRRPPRTLSGSGSDTTAVGRPPRRLLSQLHDDPAPGHRAGDGLGRQARSSAMQERRRWPGIGEQPLAALETAGPQPDPPTGHPVDQKDALEQSHVPPQGRVGNPRRARHVREVHERGHTGGQERDQARQRGESFDGGQLANVALEHARDVRPQPCRAPALRALVDGRGAPRARRVSPSVRW